MSKKAHYYMKNGFVHRFERGNEIGESEIRDGGVYAVFQTLSNEDAEKLGIAKNQWGIVKVLSKKGKALGYNMKGNFGKFSIENCCHIGDSWHLFKPTELEVQLMEQRAKYILLEDDYNIIKADKSFDEECLEHLQSENASLRRQLDRPLVRFARWFFSFIIIVTAVGLTACGGNTPKGTTYPEELHEEEWLEVMPPEGNPEDYDSLMEEEWGEVYADWKAYERDINDYREQQEADGYETE